jgi:hypothetical protein
LSGIPLAQTDRSHCVIPTVAYPDFLLCVTNDVYVCGSLKRNKARFTPPAGRRRRWRLRRNKFSLHVWEGRKGHESPGAPSPRISCRGLLALANFLRLSTSCHRRCRPTGHETRFDGRAQPDRLRRDALPGFRVSFFSESRTSGHGWGSVVGNPGSFAHFVKGGIQECRYQRSRIPPFAKNAKDGAPGGWLLFLPCQT